MQLQTIDKPTLPLQSECWFFISCFDNPNMLFRARGFLVSETTKWHMLAYRVTILEWLEDTDYLSKFLVGHKLFVYKRKKVCLRTVSSSLWLNKDIEVPGFLVFESNDDMQTEYRRSLTLLKDTLLSEIDKIALQEQRLHT